MYNKESVSLYIIRLVYLASNCISLTAIDVDTSLVCEAVTVICPVESALQCGGAYRRSDMQLLSYSVFVKTLMSLRLR